MTSPTHTQRISQKYMGRKHVEQNNAADTHPMRVSSPALHFFSRIHGVVCLLHVFSAPLSLYTRCVAAVHEAGFPPGFPVSRTPIC